MENKTGKTIAIIIIVGTLVIVLCIIGFYIFDLDNPTKTFLRKVVFEENMTCLPSEKMIGINASGAICSYDLGQASSSGGAYVLDLSGLIPYTGATKNVGIGIYNLTANKIIANIFGTTGDDNMTITEDYINSSTGLVQLDDYIIQFFAPTAEGYFKNIISGPIEADTANGQFWVGTADGFDIALINGSYVTGITDRYMDFDVLDNSGTGWATVLRLYSNGNVTMIDGGNFYTSGNISTSKNLSVLGNVSIGGRINLTGDLHVDGNVSMKRPYGTFTDMNIQTIPVINTAYNMTFNFTEDTYLVRKYPDNYTFTTPISGDYLLEISIIAQTVTPGDRIYIWVRHNNIDIPRSTTLYDFKSANANTVIAVPFIIDLEANDNFSIQYAGTATDIKIMSYNKTAFAPETPGAIMTVSKISEITD